ncbi:hypothetical protein Dsin_011616 [Dipteronia sinensis]|uniref:Uncharacterized protein n=1 Tax=Dipteronia sinensis TaxID=43782 RepID=A0AAE0AGI7_9ROSI|nr:hypothetical protein Dsin_011616 [Dipteronia sinensis]
MTLAYYPHKSPHYKVVCVRKPNSWQAYLGIYSQLDQLDPFHYADHCLRMGYYSRYQIEVDAEVKVRKMPMPATPIPDDWNDGRRLRFVILGIIREADDGELFHIPGKAIRYNFNDNTFNMICHFSPGHEDIEIRYPGNLRFKYLTGLILIITLRLLLAFDCYAG